MLREGHLVFSSSWNRIEVALMLADLNKQDELYLYWAEHYEALED